MCGIGYVVVLRVYASSPPDWWPFWVVKPSGRLPPRRVRSVILDNGAFVYYQRGVYPGLDKWVALLARRAYRLRSVSEEVYVVLPDYPNEPWRTVMAARRARRLCEYYRCVLVMHYNSLDRLELEDMFDTYMTDIDANLYAVPLKLPTSLYYSVYGRKVVTKQDAQVRIVSIANELARKHLVHLHLLAPGITVLRRIWVFQRVQSIDTTTWTRVYREETRKLLGTVSARNTAEREILFSDYMDMVCRFTGNRVEGWACDSHSLLLG